MQTQSLFYNKTPFKPLRTITAQSTLNTATNATLRLCTKPESKLPQSTQRQITFLHLQFFLTKIPNLCKLFHNPRKTKSFKKQKQKRQNPPPLQMWAM
ncbi:hypothetical protein T36_0401 [Helicobacter cinaedi]|uniref:hypothetical protein n=1 Tax=Helicobacter cinaedi TaxID=213 RepID=UPI001F278667|nr:hypothetical protein [Helicobacter cinaedi]BDB63773.1 hypothetical protein T36_0217 [Helicobacter cinaedi]BDB63954.1 hypothetical protein T36_0401 [Helicobacter cinaedi]